ncbi:MAG TPA: class I SAM-dependent methyltransferase [Bryobacteraceae bacterium]|nr:class I SAM-dependent methyltransferase [Bryobacteraceae bacterium]
MFTYLLHRLVAWPAVYDVVQTACGAGQSRKRVRKLLQDVGGVSVLDVGAGTGNGLRVLPPRARYLWLDNDPQKLAGLKSGRAIEAILASATAMPLASHSVDVVLCIAMAHHLNDQELLQLLDELSRVCRDRLIFLDPIASRESFMSRLLWRYDRGSYPRTSAALRRLIQQKFNVEYEEEYSIYHRYWLCSARITPELPGIEAIE